MDSSKKTEDDTIRDSAESGYVSTRPRFTRVRRTWPFNVRNLVAEDIRTLDQFFMATAARGANSFLYPNLLPNWSFEFPALADGDLAYGWSAAGDPQLVSGVYPWVGTDGPNYLLSYDPGVGGVLAAGQTATAQVRCSATVPCQPGEVYLFTGSLAAQPSGIMALTFSAYPAFDFFDANGNSLSTVMGTAGALTGAFYSYGYQLTVPDNAASFAVRLCAALTNPTGAAIGLDGVAFAAWDAVGCALQTPLTPYGRMVGSAPLGCLVRFSSLPEVADIGWGNGVKVYGVKLELTEV